MRTIIFTKEDYLTDPVRVGDILRIRTGNKWSTVIAVNDGEPPSCEGCLFNQYDQCWVPRVNNSAVTTLCVDARCIFKDINTIMENL